jgi:hypothetical protein
MFGFHQDAGQLLTQARQPPGVDKLQPAAVAHVKGVGNTFAGTINMGGGYIEGGCVKDMRQIG